MILTLFHYCSTNAFYSILRNRSLWLSSLSASNDTQEGKWLSVVFESVCQRNGLSEGDTAALLQRFRWAEATTDCLGLCLSSQGDMLSQWRGYANDATGFSIGFSEDLFKQIPKIAKLKRIRLEQVLYDERAQIELLESRFGEVLRLLRYGALDAAPVSGLGLDEELVMIGERVVARPSRLASALRGLSDIMYVTKNPAFSEEHEWRLVSEVHISLKHCQFRVRGDALVPYHEVPFPPPTVSPQLDCVILGPRNPTPDHVVKAFLESNGYRGCAVRRSVATYRGS